MVKRNKLVNTGEQENEAATPEAEVDASFTPSDPGKPGRG